MKQFHWFTLLFLWLNTLSPASGDVLKNPAVHFNESDVYTTGQPIQFKITAETNVTLSNDTIIMTLYYGDGSNFTYFSTASEIQSLNTAVPINHSYSYQGNFSVYGELTCNGSVSVTPSKTIYIWNPINMDISSKSIAAVDEKIQFVFISPPEWNVHYTIDFGDNNISQHRAESFQIAFPYRIIVHSYAIPGLYNVTLHAWNSMYTYVNSTIIRIEYPISNGSLSISKSASRIPIPDGKATFTLSYSSTNHDPSNVRCIFDYGDNNETIAVNLTNSQPIQRIHFYRTAGQMNVVFTCTNDLSHQVVKRVVNLDTYKLSEISFHYKNPVPMSMELEQVIPTLEYNHYFKSVTIPKNVTFTILMRKFPNLPSGISVFWDFNDGTPLKHFELESPTVAHTFAGKRGTYNMVIKMNNSDNEYTFYKSITLGIIKLTCNTRKFDLRVVNVQLKAEGISGDPSYTFDVNTNLYSLVSKETYEVNQKMNGTTYTFRYEKYGFYIPSVYGIHTGNEKETVYLDEPLIADLSVEDVLSLNVQPIQIPLPPGTVFINVNSSSITTRPFVTCEMKPGDAVDRDSVFIKRQNVSSTEPMVFSYAYTSLGTNIVAINCSNYISVKTMKKNVTTLNSCFDTRGIFDRQYSIPTNPMKVFAANDLYISNRMEIFCKDNINFHWKLFQTNNTEEVGLPIEYENPIKEGQGRMLIRRNTLKEGLIYFHLNVTLSTTWFAEYIFIQFHNSHPFAYIVGGDYVIGLKNMAFDALSESRIAYLDLGKQENLTFTWKCERFSRAYMSMAEIRIDETPLGTCLVNETSRGIVQLSPVMSTDLDYAVTVTVHVGSVKRTFTQIASITETGPSLAINCSLNCNDKVSVSSKLTLIAWCQSCVPEDDVKYDWHLWENLTGRYERVLMSTENQENDTTCNSQAFNVPSFVLQSGKTYIVTLFVTIANNTKQERKIYRKIQTNTPPTGGICSVSQDKDAVTLISVNCSNWIDPDDSFQTLVYLYETVIRRNLTHGIDDIVAVVYEGSESSIADVPVQAGDPVFRNVVTVRVRIFDIYGDYATFVNNITVVSNEVSSESFDKNFSKYYLSGNDIQTLNFIGAAASSLKQVLYVDSNEVSSESFDEKFSIYYFSGNDIQTLNFLKEKNSSLEQLSDTGPEITNYQQRVLKLIRQVEQIITPGCNNSHGRYNLADIQTIYSTLDALTRYQPYLTLEAVNTTTDILNTVIGCLEIETVDRPLSTTMLDKLTLVAKVFHRLLDNILNKMLPKKLHNLDEELSQEELRSTIILKTTRFLQETSLLKQNQGNVTLNHQLINLYASVLFQIRSHERSKQIKQRELAKRNIPCIKNMLSVFIKIMENTVAIGKRLFLNGLHVLEIMIRKVSGNNLSNTNDPFFAGLYQRNNSEHHYSYLTISIANFLKNPYIYGENASLATSSVPVIKIPQNVSVDSNLPNIGKPVYKRYIPLMNPAYSEKMIYFTFDIINDEDASIIYIKPDGFDKSSQRNMTLYSFFFSSKTFPKATNFDYSKVVGVRDWTNYGFKVFLRGGICRKGNCFLGIQPHTGSSSVKNSLSRKKRAVSNTTTQEPFGNATSLKFKPVEANFSLIFTTTGCRTWTDDNNSWTMEGCTVLPMSDLNYTVCRCTGNTFSSSFYIPPNVINFLTVWGKFDASNASVYGTLTGVFVIYLVAVILLRRQDRKDVDQWTVPFLSDHTTSHVYFYLISVHTGLRKDAGTKSNVQFIITGDLCDSGTRVLHERKTKEFSTSSVNKFFFGTTEPLGDLLYLRIWHDNSGPPGYQSWFLGKVIIDDLQTKKRYFFFCNKWLAIDDGDCTLDRFIPVSAPNLISLKKRLSDETQTLITEHHLWLSLFFRPQQSKFTRVQRISCLLALSCLIMISNATFFRSSSENQKVDQVKFGLLRISSSTFYVSCIGILISTLPVVFASYVFRHINNDIKTKQKSSESKNFNRPYKSNDISVSMSDVDFNVFQQEDDKFPHWIYYLAWIILAMSVLSSCFFLILYSMEWGSMKSEEWLSSFVFSLVESLVVFDPMKVLIIAISCSTLLTNWYQERAPNINLRKLKKISLISKGYKETNISELTKYVFPTYDLLSEEERTDLKKICQEKSKAKSALRNIIFFTLYIIAIYLISYFERDKRSFHLKENLDNYLIFGKKGPSAITDKKGFYTWLNETFIPRYYPVNNYASKPLTVVDRQWFQDMASIRVGPARLRQVRMKSGSCKYSKLVGTYPCIETYSELNEDQSLYCLEWESYNDSICGTKDYKNRFYTADSWKYTKASDIWGISRMGEYNTYSGGGYILKFVKNRANAYLLLKELVENDWIDRKTRAVFLEFTMYNPNVNLFHYAMLLTEFPEVGGVVTWTDIQAFKPILNFSSLGFGLVMAYMIVLCYNIFLLFKILWNCSNFGCITYFKEPWNIVDCISTCLAYSCFVIIVVKMNYTSTAMNMFYEDKLTGANRFINYGHIVIWDNAFNIFFAVLVFVSTIQILKILGYNKRFTEIQAVITNARKDLLSFGVLLAILLIAFVFLAYLLFGSRLENYKSIYITCGSLANTFIGKNKLDPLVIASPLTAQFFYVTYVFFVIMFMLTVFLSILNNSISAVRADTAMNLDSLGILHIVKDVFRRFHEKFFKFKKNVKYEKSEETTIRKEINAVNVMTLIRDIVTIYWNEERKIKEKSKDNVEEKCKQSYSSSLKLDSCGCQDLVKENNDEEISKNKRISRLDAVSILNIDAKLRRIQANVHQ